MKARRAQDSQAGPLPEGLRRRPLELPARARGRRPQHLPGQRLARRVRSQVGQRRGVRALSLIHI
eukprot:7894632-Alexandrium_andersonii.AAC.1